MSNAEMVTIPELQRRQGLAFRLDALTPWQHADVVRTDDELALQVRTLLYSTNMGVTTAKYAARTWVPDWGQLKLAVITLIESGLNLSPSAGLCCLLSFWNEKAKQHDVQPYIMREGLKALANQCWTITGMSTVVGVKGDEWDCRFISGKGWSVTCVPGKDRGRVVLTDTSGAFSYEPIIGVATDIYFQDRGPHTGILQNPRLREKLMANRNALKGWGAWASTPIAMIENMSQREALKGIPLTGKPLASRMLRDTWDRDNRATQLHLQGEAMARQLPASVEDDIESIDVVATEHSSDSSDDDQDPFEFVAQDAPDLPTGDGMYLYRKDSEVLKAQLFAQQANHEFANCRETCAKIRAVWAEHISTPFQDAEIEHIEEDVQ